VKSAIDTFVGFSYAPIRAISYFGLIVSVLSFLLGFYLLINKLVFGTQVEGWTSVMLAVLVLGGVQLVMIGVLGEYLWRVLEEARARPLYILEQGIGFEVVDQRVVPTTRCPAAFPISSSSARRVRGRRGCMTRWIGTRLFTWRSP